MIRRLVAAATFLCMVPVLVANATANEPPLSTSMRFGLRQEGPSSTCRDRCRLWVFASGTIKADTANEFEMFAARHDLRGATIALNSEGGSVLGAMALGRAIRGLDMTTTIGQSIDLSAANGETPRAIFSPRANCESMCAFVLLAGVARIVPPEANVRVHQIWLGDRREDAAAAAYSAEDLVVVQHDIGKLAQYTIEMGGSADFLELSLRVPPWEPMHVMTREELRRMRLDTVAAGENLAKSAPIVSAAAGDSAKSAAVATSAPSEETIHRAAPNGERGWSLVERAGEMMLVRQHPLTLRGDTIGGFAVMLGCGRSRDEFSLHYVETRHGNGKTPATESLTRVSIAVANDTVKLAVAASEAMPSRAGRNSATGAVPAAAVKLFAGSDRQSLIVATSSANNATTSIRVGNTGMAQYLPRLAAACARRASAGPAGAHADLPAATIKKQD